MLDSHQLITMLKSISNHSGQSTQVQASGTNQIVGFERPSLRKADPDCIERNTHRMLDG